MLYNKREQIAIIVPWTINNRLFCCNVSTFYAYCFASALLQNHFGFPGESIGSLILEKSVDYEVVREILLTIIAKVTSARAGTTQHKVVFTSNN